MTIFCKIWPIFWFLWKRIVVKKWLKCWVADQQSKTTTTCFSGSVGWVTRPILRPSVGETEHTSLWYLLSPTSTCAMLLPVWWRLWDLPLNLSYLLCQCWQLATFCTNFTTKILIAIKLNRATSIFLVLPLHELNFLWAKFCCTINPVKRIRIYCHSFQTTDLQKKSAVYYLL